MVFKTLNQLKAERKGLLRKRDVRSSIKRFSFKKEDERKKLKSEISILKKKERLARPIGFGGSFLRESGRLGSRGLKLGFLELKALSKAPKKRK